MTEAEHTILRAIRALHDTQNYVAQRLDHLIATMERAALRPLVTIHHPSGETTMSGTQPTALAPVTILVPPSGSTEPAGWVYVFPIGVANSDGTPPTVSLSNPGTITGGTVQGPDANGQFGWSAIAAVAGEVDVTFSADGVPNYTLAVTVQNATDETLTIAPAAVSTGAPGTKPPAFT